MQDEEDTQANNTDNQQIQLSGAFHLYGNPGQLKWRSQKSEPMSSEGLTRTSGIKTSTKRIVFILKFRALAQ